MTGNDLIPFLLNQQSWLPLECPNTHSTGNGWGKENGRIAHTTGELSWVDVGFLGRTDPGWQGEGTALHV